MSGPAPLDLGRLESEAKATAAKHVSNLLQRPDQLDKVDQIRRRVARKKASVEAMLKAAVQSQLDGVRTGLNQLQTALQEVYEIKQSLDDVEETYKSISPLMQKLKPVRNENANFCQLAAAIENWKHIFTVPESVRKTEEYISDGKLLLAHKHLRELETSRDDLLFELHKQPTPSPTDRNTLKQYFGDVERLSEGLGKQLWLIVHRTLISVRREPSLTVTALRIIEREERTDVAHLKRQEQTGFMPPGRPKRWRYKCFKVLEESISSRIEGTQLEDREKNKMWLVRHLEITRQLMVEDFRIVKTILPPVFPPEYNIETRFLSMYHNVLSQHLTELIQQELEGKEIVNLLTWVNAYDGPELLKHPELKLDTSDLGPLLETSVRVDLQNQYLRTMKTNVAEWLGNSLRSDVKDWYSTTETETDGEGFYNTSLPVILFQMLEQNVQVAALIGQDLVQKSLEMFVDELNLFAKAYRDEIRRYYEKHLLDRAEPKFYLHYLLGNTNNSITLGSHMKKLRQQYLNIDYQEEDDDTNIRKDGFQMLADEFRNTGNSACEFILEEVFIDLRESKCLQDLLAKQWLSSPDSVDIICATLDDYNHDFKHLKPNFHTFLIAEAEKRIAMEYVKALFSKKISFKNYEERRNAAEKLCDEGYQLRDLFSQLSSVPKQESLFDVLPLLAEVLKLRDSSMLSLEITGLVNKHPDIRLEQIITLLLCRGDVNRSEARQIALDVLGEDELRSRPRGIFSEMP